MATPGPTPASAGRTVSITNHPPMNGKKTYLTALAAVLTAWAAYFSGALALEEAVKATFAAVLAATLRHGITSEGLRGVVRLLPLLAVLTFAAALTSCAALTVEPGAVCAGTAGAQICWHPATRTWRAETPAGTIVYTGPRDRVEPPLPDK